MELSPTINNFENCRSSLLGEGFSQRIYLNNNNKTISDNEEPAETFNKHFSKLVESLDIDKTLASNIASSDITDPVFKAIKKYENHPSIKTMKHFMRGNDLKFVYF